MNKVTTKLIVFLMLLVALINQIIGKDLLITVGLLWFAHVFRYIEDLLE